MLVPTQSARRWLGIAVATAMLASLIPLTGVAAAAATHLLVTAPASVVSGQAFNVTVTAQDGANATDATFTDTVHITSTNGTPTLPADYDFVPIVDNGVHIFSVTLANFGNSTVTVTDTGNGSITGTSGTIAVHASTLVFTTQPGGAPGGSALSPQPSVEIRDATGAVVTDNNFGGNLAVTLAIQNNPGAGTLSGCASNPLTATAGVANFNTCSINKSGIGYTLSANAPGIPSPVISSAFTMTLGAATKLAFTSYPTNPSTTSLVTVNVAIQDAGGNTVASASATIALSSSSGSLSCTGGLSHATTSGVATFTGCTLTPIANNYTLHADDGGALTDITGPTFNVTSGLATRLAFCWGSVATSCSTVAPTTSAAGTAFPTQPTIIVQDASGNRVTTDSSTSVTLAIASGTPTSGGPGTLTCSGTGTTMTVSSGVASFSGCSIDKLGTAYKLNATSSPSFTAAQSLAFDVAGGLASKLVFTTQPTSAAAGAAFPVQPVVAITDAGGNTSTTTSATITLTIGTNPGSGTLTCTGGNAKATVSGVASFTGCFINNAGTGYTLVATATNVSPTATLTAATSNAFNVTGQTAQLTLTTTATVITWGSGITLTTHFASNGNAKQFTLQRSSPNHVSWSTIATLTADSSGNASLFYRPATNNWYRAVFAGTGDLVAANSNEVRVVVRQIAILRPTNGGLVKNVALGSSRAFVTTVRPARPELPATKVSFVFYHKIAGHWTLVTTRNVFINGAGVARYTFRFGSAGEWYVRSIANPTAANANSVWSRVERYHVG